ncbi:MAG TPA: GNAT family N-acetyltransferase [bacterium]|nr:GNAT family N-acetyltransferase [bacterium]
MPLEFDAAGEFSRALVQTKDGREFVVRPCRPADRPLLERMFRSCSKETLYTRFLSPGLGVPLRYLDRLMRHNPPSVISLMAECGEDGEPRAVALMNFVETGPENHGEIAIVVQDEFQNNGLGSVMLQLLYELARKKGVKKFVADIDASNRRVFHLIKRSAMPCTISIFQGVAHAELDMTAAPSGRSS